MYSVSFRKKPEKPLKLTKEEAKEAKKFIEQIVNRDKKQEHNVVVEDKKARSERAQQRNKQVEIQHRVGGTPLRADAQKNVDIRKYFK
jgi:hypothetical protein